MRRFRKPGSRRLAMYFGKHIRGRKGGIRACDALAHVRAVIARNRQDLAAWPIVAAPPAGGSPCPPWVGRRR